MNVFSDDDQNTVLLQNSVILKNRYQLVRKLGEGGFGSVHLAHDLALHDRPVVVKIQLVAATDDPWFERKFSEEVRALSLIDHPGVVSAIDSGRTPDGKPFLVMQYVDGVTLREAMSPAGLPHARAGEILKQMGHALAAAHEKGIWHRDLKPENLMLQKMAGGGERVRLIDFGIATVADLNGDSAKTRVAGSLKYMAPEQRLGQPSAAADIYAMGLIARELLPGPLPTAAERLIQRCLARDPGERPVDARELGEQLYGSLVGSEVTRVTARVPDPPRSSRRFWLAGIVMAGAAFTAYFQGSKPVKPVSAPAVVPVEKPVRLEPSKPELVIAPAAAADPLLEKDAWSAAKWSGKAEGYQAYVDRYPEGRHAKDARKKIADLEKKDRQGRR